MKTSFKNFVVVFIQRSSRIKLVAIYLKEV
jgi:hypothetical protein